MIHLERTVGWGFVNFHGATYSKCILFLLRGFNYCSHVLLYAWGDFSLKPKGVTWVFGETQHKVNTVLQFESTFYPFFALFSVWCFCSKIVLDCISFNLKGVDSSINLLSNSYWGKILQYFTGCFCVHVKARLKFYTRQCCGLYLAKNICFKKMGKLGTMSDERQCFFQQQATVSVENFLCVRLCSGDAAWMGSQHLGFKRKQQPELLSVWKPRLPCSVSSAIVLVIVNLGHLPGGISHSSNKFHKENHKVFCCWLPFIEFWAHKHTSKYLKTK